MSSGLTFDTAFYPAYGEAVFVAAGVARVTANNASPFTFYGTNTYIVGHESVAVIDPGPANEPHLDALMNALNGREVSHILVTHTHRDHSSLAERLKDMTGAPIVAEGKHRAARANHAGEVNCLAESSDTQLVPDLFVTDGGHIDGDGWTITAHHTPGHTANHMVFALDGTGLLFSGDHVMAWSTTVVAPPDGCMSDFMRSLQKLIERDDNTYFPGHGGPVANPKEFLTKFIAHRHMRSENILKRIVAGDHRVVDIVKAIYVDTDPRLHQAACLSVFAHLEDLVDQGVVLTEGETTLGGAYWTK